MILRSQIPVFIVIILLIQQHRQPVHRFPVVFLSRKDLKPVFPCIQHQIFRFPLIICIQHCDIREMPGGLPVRKVHQILDKRGKLHICPDPVCQSEKLDPRKFFQLILRTPVRLFRGELVLAVTGKDNRTCSCCPYDPLQGLLTQQMRLINKNSTIILKTGLLRDLPVRHPENSPESLMKPLPLLSRCPAVDHADLLTPGKFHRDIVEKQRLSRPRKSGK